MRMEGVTAEVRSDDLLGGSPRFWTALTPVSGLVSAEAGMKRGGGRLIYCTTQLHPEPFGKGGKSTAAFWQKHSHSPRRKEKASCTGEEAEANDSFVTV